jgi:hypothetical protein
MPALSTGQDYNPVIAEKLKSTFDEAGDFEHVKTLIDELVSYYKIPFNL